MVHGWGVLPRFPGLRLLILGLMMFFNMKNRPSVPAAWRDLGVFTAIIHNTFCIFLFAMIRYMQVSV